MGDLAINTPAALTQCRRVTITWTGGVAPYYAGYIAAGTIQSTATPSPAVTLKTDQTSRIWECNVAAGVSITLTVRDSNGQIVYSAPSTVQNSSDTSCLPGYVADSSSGLSGGAIGGIVGGIIGGLLILGLILGLLWRRRKRRRNEMDGYGYRKEKESFEEGGEPKVEPYVGRGEVDLGSGGDESPLSGETSTITRTTSTPPTDLERQTKQMLGVSSPSTSTGPSHSQIPPIPTKSQQASSPMETTIGRNDPSPSAASPAEEGRRSPVRREQEIEYVRHTDGGMVQVELPPLYSDVPRG